MAASPDEVLHRLVAKHDPLDLTADEHALVCDLLTPADAEVSGYTTSFTGMLSSMALKRPMPRPGSTNILAESGNGGL